MFAFTNVYIIFYIVCFILAFLVAPNTGPFRIFWLVFMQVLLVVSIIPVFVFAIMGLRKKVNYSGYIIFASLIFTVSTQVYMQYITGNLPDSMLTRNAVNIGFSFEICLLALALSIRFKNYKLHAEELLREMNTQQENIFKTVSEYQEKEMNRLSGILHDSIGAGLSSIKYNLEALQNNSSNGLLESTIEDVTLLTDEVRNISHSLSPVLLQKKGLVKALQDLIAPFNRTGKIAIQLESIGSLHSSSFQNELLVYRIIQELLQNAIKHAHATEVIIQIILEEELISIFVEDNGRGFDTAFTKEGLGFSQIRGLVTFVSGRFEVDSQVNKGCRVSIEFPLIPHEATDKTVTGR
jgi:signal transduction histidine kinase